MGWGGDFYGQPAPSFTYGVAPYGGYPGRGRGSGPARGGGAGRGPAGELGFITCNPEALGLCAKRAPRARRRGAPASLCAAWRSAMLSHSRQTRPCALRSFDNLNRPRGAEPAFLSCPLPFRSLTPLPPSPLAAAAAFAAELNPTPDGEAAHALLGMASGPPAPGVGIALPCRPVWQRRLFLAPRRSR